VALTVPDAKIMPLRILDQNGEGELWRITAALIWAANNGADVANLSLGYPNRVRLLKDLLDDLDGLPTGTQFPIGTNRLQVAVSSGNGGNTTPIYPAAEQADGMLSVTASTRYDSLALFSTYDRSFVDVSAPGEDIVSALPGGRYGVWSGTSMAAPIVAGIAALVKARYPSTCPTPHEYLDHIQDAAVRIEQGTLPPWNVDIRHFRVDARNAVATPPVCEIPAKRFDRSR
jgi:thermitase